MELITRFLQQWGMLTGGHAKTFNTMSLQHMENYATVDFVNFHWIFKQIAVLTYLEMIGYQYSILIHTDTMQCPDC